jgi:hypothetical protein
MTVLACRARRARPLLAWLLRGAFGILLLLVAASTQEPLIVIAALLAALVAFGGCPMCWTLGLVERASQKRKSFIPGKDAP